MPAATTAGGGKATPEARAKTADKTMAEARAKTALKMVEPSYDDDRWREAKIPGRTDPIRKDIGIGRRCWRRHLIDLRRQPRRILCDLPAPVGLLAGFDDRLARLPAD